MQLRSSILAASLAALSSLTSAQNGQLPSGVAVGDVTSDSAIVWARPTVPGLMLTAIAPDRRSGTGAQWLVSPSTTSLEPIKHLVTGLLPGMTYYHISFDVALNFAGGLFRTAPAPGARRGLRFGVSGDSRGDVMPFYSARNMPRRNLAFLALLGDTIYADVESPALPGVQQASSLEEFRMKHAELESGEFSPSLERG